MRRITFNYFLILAFGLFVGADLSAATIQPTAGATETFNVVSGDFFVDPGGEGGSWGSTASHPNNYPNCGCLTSTTLSAASAIRLEFVNFSIWASFDWIRIYDGTSSSDPLLYGNGNGDPCDGQDYFPAFLTCNGSAFVQSTGTDMYIEFNATTVVNSGGWEANILVLSSPCEIVCPDNITQGADVYECGAQVTVPNPTLVGDCAALATLLSEDFESGTASSAPAGWTISNSAGAATIGGCNTGTTHQFVCAEFQGTPPPPPPGFSGQVATLDDDGAGIGHNGILCLTTPVVDLSAETGQRIKYDYQFDRLGNAQFTTEGWDGASWINIATVAVEGSGAADLDLGSFTNSDFQARFCHDDNTTGWNWGVALDNVQVTAAAGSPTIINDYNGTDDASDFYPVGTTTVTFTVFDASGVPVTCSIDVTVVDDLGPMMNCPSDATINLDGGECGQVINYEVTAFDNCPPSAISLTQNPQWPPLNPIGSFTCAFGVADEMSYWRIWDIPVTSSGTIDVQSIDLGVRNSDGSDFLVEFYTLDQLPLSFANITLIESRVVSSPVVINPPQQFINFDLGGPVTIPSGTQVVSRVSGVGAIFPDQGIVFSMDFLQGETDPTYMSGCEVSVPGVLTDITDLDQFGPFWTHTIQINLATEGVEITQIDNSGLTSGDLFPIGTTTQIWQAEDENGNISTCEFSYTVLEYPFPIAELACNDLVYVSVEAETCEALITADMLLEGGPYGCYDHYIITIETESGISVPNPVTGNYLGQTLVVTVTDPETGNSCWGNIILEDKFIPELSCSEYEVGCADDITPGTVNLPAQSFYTEDEPGSFITVGSPVDIEIPVSMPGTFTQVTNIDMELDISHTWVGDLSVTLTAPSGNSVNVIVQDNCLNNDIDVAFDDDFPNPYTAYANMCNATPPAREGDFQPSQAFAGLNGEDANGTWILTVNDGVGGDDGTLNFYSLQINANAQSGLPMPLPPTATVTPTPGPGITGPYVVSNFDACGDVTLSYEDVVDPQACDDQYSSILNRIWTAVDESGNTTSCVDVVNFRKATIAGLNPPPNYDGLDQFALECGADYNPFLPFGPDNWDVNGNGYPDPEETGGPSGAFCDNIVFTSSDAEISTCGGSYKVLRTWTVLDWCTGESDDFLQIIKVTDTQPPVITCPDTYTAGVDYNSCYGTVNVPPVDIYDACGGSLGVDHLTVSSSAGTVVPVTIGGVLVGYQIVDVPAGIHTITYTANDGCGNEGTCETTLYVDDHIAPVPICDVNTNVSLGSDGEAIISWQTFDDGSYDNCGIVSYKVRRDKRGKCRPGLSNNDRIWKDAEEFCCEDIEFDNDGNQIPIIIEMQVTDAAGNQNSCWVNVWVEDKLPPFIQAPPNVTVSCDFPFDLWDLSVFGNVVRPQDPYYEVRETRVIDDPHYGPMSITDGYAADNCGLTVNAIYSDDLECGQGRITRVFTATDDYGRSSTAVQFIFVVDHDPFEVCDNEPWCTPAFGCTPPANGIGLGVGHTLQDDIEWPCDIRLDDCSIDVADLSPASLVNSSMINDNTGQGVSRDAYPDWNDDNCSQIAATYKDDVFDIVPDACMKILRHWKVIDWCQYDEASGAGIWEYTQVIKVLDDEVPEFPGGCADITICDTAAVGCTGYAYLAPALNECTPAEYLNWAWRIYAFEINDEPTYCDNTVDMDVHIDEITNRVTVIRFGDINSPVVPGGDIVRYSTDGGANFFTYFGPFTAPDNLQDLLIIRTVDYDDDCDTDVTYYGASGDASRYYPFGTHRIQWWVEDMCGNYNTCDYNFTMEDCKKPSPVCLAGISTVVMPVNGMIAINAEFWDAASFDNCDEDLDFRVWSPIMDSANYADQSHDWQRPSAGDDGDFVLDYLPEAFTVACANITNGVSETFMVEIYVVDDYGNWDYCQTFVIVDDVNDVCNGTSSAITIAGAISNEGGEGVDNVDVRLVGGFGNQTDITQQNNELGHFAFASLPMNHNWEVSSYRNDDHLNGVTTYDLALIQRHIVQLEFLDSPYKLIAADANNDGNINVLDIVDVRKLILGLYNEFPSNDSWRFVDATAVLPAGTQPMVDFPENVSYVNANINMMSTDFVAVKIGDVNGNATPSDLVGADSRSFNGSLLFEMDDQGTEAGENVRIDVTAANFTDIMGYQFTLGFDNSLLEFVGVEAGAINVSAANFGLHLIDKGMITTSWHDVNGVKAGSNEVLFTMIFKSLGKGQVSKAFNVNSTVTVAEAYSQENGMMDIALQFNTEEGVVKADAFALLQNTPNPFTTTTVVGFVMPEAADATMTVYDLTGKVLKVVDGQFAKGYNEVTFKRSDFGSAGVLYYQLDTEGYTATKKMIVVE